MKSRLLTVLFLSLTAIFCATAAAQDEVKPKKITMRFGYEPDETAYPQKTPKEAMTSVARALNRDTVDYLLAQLTDPRYVDFWVDRYKTTFTQGKEETRLMLAFERLAKETAQYFQDDPLIVRDLRAFARDAEWTEDADIAVGVVPSIASRKVFMRRIEGRWFLENRQQDDAGRK